MYQRNILEKKANSIAMTISALSLVTKLSTFRQLLQNKFLPCSCHELHGEVWASLRGFQLINWLQQLVRFVALGYMWVNYRNSFPFIHTPELFPHSSPSSLSLAQSQPSVKREWKDFPFLPHFVDIRHFLWP